MKLHVPTRWGLKKETRNHNITDTRIKEVKVNLKKKMKVSMSQFSYVIFQSNGNG